MFTGRMSSNNKKAGLRRQNTRGISVRSSLSSYRKSIRIRLVNVSKSISESSAPIPSI